MTLTASYRFIRRQFRNDSLLATGNEIGTRRADRINQVEVELVRPITQHLEISLLAWVSRMPAPSTRRWESWIAVLPRRSKPVRSSRFIQIRGPDQPSERRSQGSRGVGKSASGILGGSSIDMEAPYRDRSANPSRQTAGILLEAPSIGSATKVSGQNTSQEKV